MRRQTNPAEGCVGATAAALLCLAATVPSCGSGGIDRVPSGEPAPATDRQAAAERIVDWVRERPGEPLQSSVSFHSVLPDSTILRLLERYRVRPYLAHAWAGGVADYAQVAPDSPSADVLAEARRLVIDHLRRAVCGPEGSRQARERDEAALGVSPQQRDRAAREMLTRLEMQHETLPRVRAGAPVVWSVYVVGSPENVARLGDDPLVWVIEPAEIVIEDGVEWVAVPRPPEPEPVGRLTVGSEIGTLPGREDGTPA